MEEPIFWLDFNPEEKPFDESTIALISEIEGGVVSYYLKENMATEACNIQNEKIRFLKENY